MTRKDLNCDVAIIGYGPTGQMLALLLGEKGYRVVVFERWPTLYPQPRAVHYDHEIARVFQAAGIEDALASIVEPGGIYEWRNARGETLLSFDWSEQSVSGWPSSTMFPQPQLEASCQERAWKTSITRRRLGNCSLPGISRRRMLRSNATPSTPSGDAGPSPGATGAFCSQVTRRT